MSDNCYNLSVRFTLLLRESIFGRATFELDARVEIVQSPMGFDQQHKKDQCVVIFD